MSGFGKPKYGGNTFKQPLKLKEGKLRVRIMPPMHSLAEDGVWHIFHGTHFGYKGVNPKDPSKPQFRTFRCIQEKDFRSGVLKQGCPECDLIDEYKQVGAQQEAQARAKTEPRPYTEEEIAEMLSGVNGWLQEHNCDRKQWLNVKTEAGEFNALQIPHKTFKLLDAQIKKVMSEEGIDPLDVEQGVWFDFTRTGKKIETQDTVEIVQETVRENGRLIKTTKLAPLTVAEQEQALAECPDLNSVVRVISEEQIRLLTKCSGDPEEVDRILAMGRRETSPARSAPRPSLPPPTVPARQAPAVQSTPEPVASEGDDEEKALLAQLAALKAKKANPAPVVEQPELQKAEQPAQASLKAAPVLELPKEKFMGLFKKQ